MSSAAQVRNGPPEALQALKNGGMLAVHGQDMDARFARRLHHQRAARHERLLVGQQHALAAVQGRHDRGKARNADHGDEHVLRVGLARDAGDGILAEDPVDAVLQILRNLCRRNAQARHARTESAHLLKKARIARTGGQCRHLKAVGVQRGDLQRLRADGAGRTQYGQFTHAHFSFRHTYSRQ